MSDGIRSLYDFNPTDIKLLDDDEFIDDVIKPIESKSNIDFRSPP